MKYNAFISYSHKTDPVLAPSLETALEQFARPAFKRRALVLFRDQNDLSASPDLWESIENGLKNAEYFIFMASPKAAQSKWCKREVEFWKTQRDPKKMLIALTEGTIAWNDENGDFDWEKTTAVPDNLSGVFKHVPLYIDFRQQRDEAGLNLENIGFRTGVVQIAATLHGKTVGEMDSENVKQHKRRIRIRNAAIALLSVLLTASAILSWLAYKQFLSAQFNFKEAVKQKNLVIAQTRVALAKSYLADSRSFLSTNPTLSLNLACYAYRFGKANHLPPGDFTDQLIRCYNQNPDMYFNPENMAKLAKQQTDTLPEIHEYNGFRINFVDYGEFNIENLKTGDKHHISPEFAIKKYTFLPGTEIILMHCEELGLRLVFQYIYAFDYSGKILGYVQSTDPEPLPQYMLNSSHNKVVLFGGGEAVVIETSRPHKTHRLHFESEVISCSAISSDGKHAAFGCKNGLVHLWQYNVDNELENHRSLSGHFAQEITGIHFNSSGTELITQSKDYTRKWLVTQRRTVFSLPYEIGRSNYSLGYNPDTCIIGGEYRMLAVYMTGNGDGGIVLSRGKDTIFFDSFPDFQGIRYSPDKKYYATASGLFNNKNEKLIAYTINFEYASREVHPIVFSRDGKYLLAEQSVYCLDAEEIVKRLSNPAIFGPRYQFTNEDKKQFMINESDLNTGG